MVLCAYLNLWLASSYVALEGWEKQSLSAPEQLDSALVEMARSLHSDAPLKLRNKVFHAEIWNHEHIKQNSFSRNGMKQWSGLRRCLASFVGCSKTHSKTGYGRGDLAGGITSCWSCHADKY